MFSVDRCLAPKLWARCPWVKSDSCDYFWCEAQYIYSNLRFSAASRSLAFSDLRIIKSSMLAFSISWASLPFDTMACLYMDSSRLLFIYILDKFSIGSLRRFMTSPISSLELSCVKFILCKIVYQVCLTSQMLLYSSIWMPSCRFYTNDSVVCREASILVRSCESSRLVKLAINFDWAWSLSLVVCWLLGLLTTTEVSH